MCVGGSERHDSSGTATLPLPTLRSVSPLASALAPVSFHTYLWLPELATVTSMSCSSFKVPFALLSDFSWYVSCVFVRMM